MRVINHSPNPMIFLIDKVNSEHQLVVCENIVDLTGRSGKIYLKEIQ